jgi:PKHD-type hydroxylase
MVNNVYWLWEGVLSKEFCNFVLGEADWDSSKKATVSLDNEFIVKENTRQSDIIWQDVFQPLGCIAKTYIDIANQSAGWNYDLFSQDNTQLSRYKGVNGGHYDWHKDCLAPENGMQRKLSISILLSDPSEFEGVDLQFKNIEDRKILTKQGSIVVFPSFVEHRVKPVTKGVRYSAVTWASGPAFK